jgi:hypothetical protein
MSNTKGGAPRSSPDLAGETQIKSGEHREAHARLRSGGGALRSPGDHCETHQARERLAKPTAKPSDQIRLRLPQSPATTSAKPIHDENILRKMFYVKTNGALH